MHWVNLKWLYITKKRTYEIQNVTSRGKALIDSPKLCNVGPVEAAVTFKLIGVWAWGGGFVLFGDEMVGGLLGCCVRRGVRTGCCKRRVSPTGICEWGGVGGGGFTRLMWCVGGAGWYKLEWWCDKEWLWWWCAVGCWSNISWWMLVVPDECFWSKKKKVLFIIPHFQNRKRCCIYYPTPLKQKISCIYYSTFKKKKVVFIIPNF